MNNSQKEFEKAKEIYWDNPSECFNQMEQLSDIGHVPAKNKLAGMYYAAHGTKKDLGQSFKLYTEAAEAGDAEGQHHLGYCYMHGYGTEVNQDKATQLFSEAANNGNNESKYSLGRLLLDDREVKPNSKEEEAIALITEAAEAGLKDAVSYLGIYLINSNNTEDGIKWLEIAAKKDCEYANNALGKHWERNGDFTKAIEYYQLSAEKTYQPAIKRLTELFDHSDNNYGVRYKDTSHYIKLKDKAFKLCKQKKYSEALSLLEELAEKGCDISTQQLGYMYKNGLGVDKSAKKAFNFTKDAHELGNIKSSHTLGKYYIEGTGVTKDINKGIEILKKLASEENYHSSLVILGKYYFDGKVTEKNYKLAHSYWSKAHDIKKDYGTYNNLGLMYENGHCVSKDLDKAYDYYNMSILLGGEHAVANSKRILKKLFPSFDKSLLNYSGDLEIVVSKIADSKLKNFSMLISGPSGTGKKSLANYLANEMKSKTTLISALDIGSRKDLDETIETAEKENKILIISDLSAILSSAQAYAHRNFESKKLLSKLAEHLENSTLPIIVLAKSTSDLSNSFIEDFIFHVKLNYLDKTQVEKAYTRFFSMTPPKELSSIGGLTIKDFTRTKKKLLSIGETKNEESILESLQTFSDSANIDSSDGFNTKLINASEDIGILTNKIMRSNSPEFSMILYGVPGTGKSRFLRYLAMKLGYDVIEKKASELGGKYYSETEKNIAEMFKEATEKKAFLIIDEIDSMIPERDSFGSSESRMMTSKVNEFLVGLEGHKYPVCVTTNNIDKIDRAALRRFLFKLEFNYLTKKQSELAYADFFERKAPKTIEGIGGLVPSDFATVQKKARFFGELDDDELIDLLKSEVNTKSRSEIAHLESDSIEFDFELSNPSIDLEEMQQQLSLPDARRDFSILIYGPPGTGKSQYLKYLASKLGMEVIVKRYSDIMSKWYGEGEKNIAAMFKEAKDRQAFLIIDEADSLLRSRDDAGMKQFEMTKINEMLTWMDSHPFPIGCTTNLMDKIDPAAKRRFLFSFEMDYLKPEQLSNAFKHFLGCSLPEKFSKFNKITPALLANARKKADIFGIKKDAEKLLKLVEEELKIYGFTEELEIEEEIADEVIKIPKLELYGSPLYEHSAEILSSTVLIKNAGSHGSGFFISKKGYLLSNQHVVKDNKFVTVRLSTGRELAGEVIRTHEARDVALIKVAKENFNALPLRNTDEPSVGEDIFVIGSPLDEKHQSTMSKGIISAYKTNEKSGLTHIQTDASTHGGSSGGPVLDVLGNVISVHYSGLSHGGQKANMNFSIPIIDALKHLNIEID